MPRLASLRCSMRRFCRIGGSGQGPDQETLAEGRCLGGYSRGRLSDRSSKTPTEESQVFKNNDQKTYRQGRTRPS
jgi:hypothetical protein